MNAPLIREATLDVINSSESALEKARAMDAALGEMFAAHLKTDGSYEAARDRFNLAARGVF